jgi:hypothetical protein
MDKLNLEVPEAQKTREWYRDIALAYSRTFNKPIFLNDELLTPAQIIQRNRLYYYGEQSIGRNFSVAQGTVLENIRTKHNQIFTLCNSLHGKIMQYCQDFKPYAELLSPNAKNKKDSTRMALMFYVENKDWFQALEKLGVTNKIVAEQYQINTKEDVDDYMDMEYRPELAIIAEHIASIVIKTSDYASLKPDQFSDLLIAGFTGEDREWHNGLLVERKKLPESLILDLRNPNDDNFNSSAQYIGYWVNLASPYEILESQRDYLEPDAIVQITQAAESTITNGSFGQWYCNNVIASPTGNFNYYQVAGNGMRLNPVTGMSGIRMYFRAKVDLRYYEGREGKIKKYRDYDKNGNPIIQNQNRQGMSQCWKWHYADVWGGYWVGKHGIVENSHANSSYKEDDECPMKVYFDGYKVGMYKSRVSRMVDYQDDIDLADMKIKQAQYNDLGVNYILNDLGAESRDGLIKDVFKDFKSQHFTMLKRDTDLDPEYAKMKFTELVDFTGALNVVQIYQSIKSICIQEMNNMMHLPDVSLGTQDTTIGKGVQNTTIEMANTGLAPLFIGFSNYMQKGLQLSVNKNRLILAADNGDEDYARSLLGDRGYELLKESVYVDDVKNIERFGIYVYPNDNMNAQNMAMLDLRIQAALQNGLIKFSEAEKVRTFTSYREACNFLYRKAKQAEMKQDALREQERKDNMAISHANNQAMLQGKQIPAQAQVEAANARAEATKYQADKTQETKVHDTNTNANVKLATQGNK